MDEVSDHGGSLGRAESLFPDAPQPWLDLSTGINPHSYPLPDLAASAFRRLPEDTRLDALAVVAANAYGAPSPAHVAAAPGTQMLLPLVAGLVAPGRAAVLSPTYAEHARAAALAGHEVAETPDFGSLGDADLAVIVNPNNPDGRICRRADLVELAARLHARGGLLVVDEAFMDVGPQAESLGPDAQREGLVVLRSFGKFYGLAGVRLGFALASRQVAEQLRARLGPWAVSGPTLEIGLAALADESWRARMRRQLGEEAQRLDALLSAAGLRVAGGTDLFRFLKIDAARDLFRTLGESGILTRVFEWDARALRIGLPGGAAEFARLAAALERFAAAPDLLASHDAAE